MVKYPDVTVQLTNSDGNAFVIMGKVLGAMKKANVPSIEIGKCQEEMMSGDYDNLLQTVMKWVNVT